MNVEYEEFSSIEDMLLFLSSAAPPMKNFMPINSYKGFVCSFIPLSQTGGETYLMLYTKGDLETGIQIQLTNHPSIDTSPSYSPDGKLITFN